jgi:hypothetical protein
MRHQFLLCLALLLTGACKAGLPPRSTASDSAQTVASAPASESVGADFLSIERSGSNYQARWTEVRLSRDSGGFRTDLFAKATTPAEGEELVEAHFTIIRLQGPGEYPLGFGWDRGKSRVTLQTREGMRCMTPSSDAGVIEITVASGNRLEGRYRVHCFPEGNATSQAEPLVFTGAFAVTVSEAR